MSKESQKPSSKPSKVKIDSEAIRQLSELLKETELSEIEYEVDGRRIRVARQIGGVMMPSMMAAAPMAAGEGVLEAAPQAAGKASASPESHPGVVKSPMVGTAYLSPKPGDPPFIAIGATVTAGQTLMIIEAMKVMNPFKAPKAGKITHIFIEDGQPVEFDEPLVVIE
jgi:acetyl-CoA carboxylase biotin carboxyl carrier protein